MRFDSPSPDATAAAARVLADCLDEDGLILALIGPLGAGKTAFVKGLAEGLGIDPARVASPTFVIASEYPTRSTATGCLAHVDLFRVKSGAELEAAGFLDLLEPGAVLAVEWADRLPGVLPEDRLELRIDRRASAARPDARVLHGEALGPCARAVLERWQTALEGLGDPAGPAGHSPP